MTPNKQVHQYAHETWDQAWKRRQEENLAQIQTAVAKLDEIKERDRQIGVQMVLAFTTLGMGLKQALETL